MTMVGDSADPIIAAAAAFGADHFDRAAALAAMVRGADRTVPEPERRIRRAPGPRLLPRPRLRPLRRRHQPPQRQLDLRQPDRGLGLGGDHARVRDRRLRDRPVRGAGGRRRRATYARIHRPRRQLAQPLRPGQRPDRAALRQRRLPRSLRPAPRRRLRRGRRGAVHLDGPAGPGRADRAARRPGQGGGAPRLLPARPQRAARAGPTPTTPCSATSRPWRRPGSTTGCAAPGRRRRRSVAASASTARARPASPATTTSGRSRPGTSSARSASTRRSRGPGPWRSPRRSSNAPKCASPTASGWR